MVQVCTINQSLTLMSTTEYQQRIAAMRRALETEAPTIALRMAQTGLTLQKRDSIEDGITVDGAFAEYSNKPVYKSSFKSKALNSGGSAYAASGGKGTYGAFRAAQGRKSDKVNLFYTGEMWSSIRITAQSQTGYRYSVLVGTDNSEGARKLLANLERYGNFLKLDEDRVKVIQSDTIVDIQKIIRQYL